MSDIPDSPAPRGAAGQSATASPGKDPPAEAPAQLPANPETAPPESGNALCAEAAEEAEADDDDPLAFDPVPLRFRHDGWTPDKQDAFIRALSETGCVEEACARVKMSAAGAYKLKARPDATSVRLAWEAALDVSVGRLSDAALSRAISGVPVPISTRASWSASTAATTSG